MKRPASKKHGISSTTFYNCKGQVRRSRCVGRQASKSLEDEHTKLNKLDAKAMRDNAILKFIQKNGDARRGARTSRAKSNG